MNIYYVKASVYKVFRRVDLVEDCISNVFLVVWENSHSENQKPVAETELQEKVLKREEKNELLRALSKLGKVESIEPMEVVDIEKAKVKKRGIGNQRRKSINSIW